MISLLMSILLMKSHLPMLTITTITSLLKLTYHTSHLQFTGMTTMKSQPNNSGPYDYGSGSYYIEESPSPYV